MGRRKAPVHAIPENADKARAFMEWASANMQALRRYVSTSKAGYDEDLFSDALIRARDAIARRGTVVRNPVGYFLRTYQSAFLDARRKASPTQTDECVEGVPFLEDLESLTRDEIEARLKAEILSYVRGRYDETSVSMFEIYLGLLPDVSYKRLAGMLGVPVARIWPVMGQIRKDIATRFVADYQILLSGEVEI